MNSKKLLLIIAFIGFLLRFINVANNPPSLYWDEASIGYEAYSVAQTGKDMHGNHWLQPIFPAYGDYKAPIYILLSALATKIVGPINLAVRLPSVIFGSLTIILIYYLTNQLFPKQKYNLGLFSAVLLSISPWHLQFSRAGFEANIGLFFTTLALYFLLKARTKGYWAITAVFFGALGVYSYFSVRIVFPAIVAVLLILFYKNFKNKLIWLIGSTIIFILLLLPLFNSPYYQPSNQFRLSTTSIFDNTNQIIYANQLRESDNNNLFSRIIHHRHLYTAKELALNLSDHLSFNYLFLVGDSNPRHSTGITGIILFPLSLIFFIGLYNGWRNYRKAFILILFWWLIALIPASVPQDTPHALRSLNALPAITLILSLGISALFSWSKSNFKRLKIVGLYLVIIAISFISYLHFYHFHYPKLTNNDWQDGYRQLIEYLKTQEGDFDNYIFAGVGDRLFLYALFYTQYPPQEIQKLQQQKLADNTFDFSIKEFGKYFFTSPNWGILKEDGTTLIIVFQNNVPENAHVEKYIYDKNDQLVYIIIDFQQTIKNNQTLFNKPL